jgi:hypothetical protein
MASERTDYRGPFDAQLSIKTVRHYIRTAGTVAERAVWRGMLNGPEYNKFKNGVKLEKRRKHDPDMPPVEKKKKK